MVHSGRATVLVAGTRVRLVATGRTPASWVTVIGDISNTGTVYVGDRTTRNAALGAKTYIGHPLVIPAVGGQPNFCNLREMGGPTPYDLYDIWIDADNANDTVTFNYGVR